MMKRGDRTSETEGPELKAARWRDQQLLKSLVLVAVPVPRAGAAGREPSGESVNAPMMKMERRRTANCKLRIDRPINRWVASISAVKPSSHTTEA